MNLVLYLEGSLDVLKIIGIKHFYRHFFSLAMPMKIELVLYAKHISCI